MSTKVPKPETFIQVEDFVSKLNLKVSMYYIWGYHIVIDALHMEKSESILSYREKNDLLILKKNLLNLCNHPDFQNAIAQIDIRQNDIRQNDIKQNDIKNFCVRMKDILNIISRFVIMFSRTSTLPLYSCNEVPFDISNFKCFFELFNLVIKAENNSKPDSIEKKQIHREIIEMFNRQVCFQSENHPLRYQRQIEIYSDPDFDKVFITKYKMKQSEFFKIITISAFLFMSHFKIVIEAEGEIQGLNYPTKRFIDVLSNFIKKLSETRIDYINKYNNDFRWVLNIEQYRDPLVFHDDSDKTKNNEQNTYYVMNPSLIYSYLGDSIYYNLVSSNIMDFGDIFGPSFQKYVINVARDFLDNKDYTIYPTDKLTRKNKRELDDKYGGDCIITDNNGYVIYIEVKTTRYAYNPTKKITKRHHLN